MLATGSVQAQASADDQIFTLQLTNDYFGNSDQYFTNGFRAAWMPSAKSVPQWVVDGASYFPLFVPAGKKGVVFSLGQSNFTPDYLATTTLLRDEKPYAGWLYGVVGFVSVSMLILHHVQVLVSAISLHRHLCCDGLRAIGLYAYSPDQEVSSAG